MNGGRASETRKLVQDAQLKAISELRENGPKVVINALIAILIWVFGRYVFIPIASEFVLFGIPLPQLISLIVLVALAIIVFSTIRGVLSIIDSVSLILAYSIGARPGATEEEYASYRRGLRSIFYVLVAALVFLLFKDYLNMFHPLLSAVVLLGLAVWAVLTLMNAGRAFSRLAEYYAHEWATEMEKRVKGEG